MGLLDADISTKAWYTNRVHYYDSKSKSYKYKWTPVQWLDNWTALDSSTKLATSLPLESEVVLHQWNGKSWQRIA